MTLVQEQITYSPQGIELLASQVMATNPKSIAHDATVRDMAGFFLAYGVLTAPVIDEAGRPIGVVSRTDLLGYRNRRRNRLEELVSGEATLESFDAQPEARATELTAMEIMTPVVICVPVDAKVATVIERILDLEIRCLFVTDAHGVLVGAISVFDLLRAVVEHSGQTRSARTMGASSV